MLLASVPRKFGSAPTIYHLFSKCFFLMEAQQYSPMK